MSIQNRLEVIKAASIGRADVPFENQTPDLESYEAQQTWYRATHWVTNSMGPTKGLR